jgi:thymidylate synthase ThyX
MAYAARVVLDSVGPTGVRLTTLEVTFPRFVLAEFNTHRVFSRNSASSRAIPTAKLLQRVLEEPAIPLEWGRNRAGMTSEELLALEDGAEAERIWLNARDAAVERARSLLELKVHKQQLNRLLEPFLWHTVIVTSTEWDNFFTLRCAPQAQPEIRAAAVRMREVLGESLPGPVDAGEWHLPLVQDDERSLNVETLKKISAARCARVSYLTHGGTREIEKDLDLCARLMDDRHLSPFEHVATPANDDAFHANFRGWHQMRKEVERVPTGVSH